MANRPAHILFLNSRSELGGADMGLHAIVRYLNPSRFRTTVLLPAAGPLVGALQLAGAEIVYHDICRLERLTSPGELWTFGRRFVESMSYLRRLIRERSIDLIYTNSSAIPVGALAARLAGIPNLWHLREIWTSPRWLTWPLYRYAYLMADRIIAISRAVATGNFGREGGKIIVVRDGVDLARFQGLEERAVAVRTRLGWSRPWPVVSTVARLVPQKGITCLIEAVRRVRDMGQDVYCCIAGDIPRPVYQAYKDQAREMIRTYHLEDRVFLLGWFDDVPALLASSDLFVLASIGPEGAGLVIPEAWLAGLPVIVPDHTGPRELVQDGETGRWFRSADAQDLADKIVELLGDPAGRRAMAQAGRREALAQHDARTNTARIEQILDELLAGKR